MHLFDRDLTLEQVERLRFTGAISKNWMINGIANGGYLMALAAKAMQLVGDKHATPIVTANYMGRCLPGAVELVLEEMARSSHFTRLQAGLYQDGKEKVRVWGTFMAARQGPVAERYEEGPPEVAPLEQCVTVPAMPIHSLMENLKMRLDPASAGWLTGTLSERSEQKGWICFKEERPYDLLSILLIADSFPPPIFVSHGLVAWVPTIELSVNVRNVPGTKWLRFRLRSRYLTGGIVDEDGEVWDETGKLVCISRQIAQVRVNG